MGYLLRRERVLAPSQINCLNDVSNEKASEGGFGSISSFFFSLPSGVKILLLLLKVFGSNVRMCFEIQTILGIFTIVN
jgi:hypothetical protein